MILRANTIKPAKGSTHRVKKMGRGNASGHGTYSGRGGKGQTARSGGSRGLKVKGMRLLMQSTPKLRGFKSFHVKPAEVYLSDLEKKFKSGDKVDLGALKEKDLVPDTAKAAKILNKGELKNKLSIIGLKASKGAAEKIQAVGGSIV